MVFKLQDLGISMGTSQLSIKKKKTQTNPGFWMNTNVLCPSVGLGLAAPVTEHSLKKSSSPRNQKFLPGSEVYREKHGVFPWISNGDQVAALQQLITRSQVRLITVITPSQEAFIHNSPASCSRINCDRMKTTKPLKTPSVVSLKWPLRGLFFFFFFASKPQNTKLDRREQAAVLRFFSVLHQLKSFRNDQTLQ